MHEKSDMRYSILIVSSSDSFTSKVKRSLKGFITIDVRKSGAYARRSLIERDYDIIVVYSPLSDEFGIEFVNDSSDKTQSFILFVTPDEVYDDVLEDVTDKGVLVITKNMVDVRLDIAIRYLTALRTKKYHLEQKTLTLEEKIKEIRLVSKAKGVIMEKKGLSEDEAHRLIGKLAMDNGLSRGEIARQILNE